MLRFISLVLVFWSGDVFAAGLITPPGRNETLSFKARMHLPDGSVSYREPYLNGNAQAFPLAAQGKKAKNIDYDRICELFGHTSSVNVEPQKLDDNDELFWIESAAMYPKSYNRIILFITCQ